MVFMKIDPYHIPFIDRFDSKHCHFLIHLSNGFRWMIAAYAVAKRLEAILHLSFSGHYSRQLLHSTHLLPKVETQLNLIHTQLGSL